MRKALIWIPWILMALFLARPVSGEGFLEGKINSLVPRNARWALEVIDMNTGAAVMSIGNAKGEALTPASIVKLLTAGAVLDYADKHGK